MKKYFFASAIVLLLSAFIQLPDFLKGQKLYAKVKAAYSEKESAVKEKLKEQNLSMNDLNILITAFKDEGEFNIYAKGKAESKYKKLITYKICQSSGTLGPKRQQGDLQVPEGFYHINKFNPSSNYYLSLGVSYPNKADMINKTAKDPGGAIMIHGECVTIGCIPMTNEKIKEIYIYAMQAYACGQTKIPVYIFPFKFSDTKFTEIKKEYGSDQKVISFWNNIRTGHDKFHSTLQEVKYTVNAKGDYVFQ